jgi:hypothetical protein
MKDGEKLFAAKKGMFAGFHGHVAEEVLHWIQEDPAFASGAPDLQASYGGKGLAKAAKKAAKSAFKDRSVEAGVKVEIAGHLVDEKIGGTVRGARINGLSAAKGFPSIRVHAFLKAFRTLNDQQFDNMQSALWTHLSKVPKEDLRGPRASGDRAF